MSNKLLKDKEQKGSITERQKRIIFFSSLLILSIAFAFVWLNIFLTSSAFKERMEGMVLDVDYFLEDVVITDKRVESDVNNSVNENYFFYYQNGKSYDYHKRMQVPESIYLEYEVGDTITAYTTDHSHYSYYKHGILPDSEFRNNELMKVVGVLLGIGIIILLFFRVLDKAENQLW